jgi:hypothetical protein
MPSSKESDSAPVRETALSFGLATRRSTPVKTDADIEHMVTVTGVIADRFDAVKKIHNGNQDSETCDHGQRI